MLISVVNHTNGNVSDEELQKAIRAINRQIAEDFYPQWSMGAVLKLEGPTSKRPAILSSSGHPTELRGQAILYLWDEVNVEEAVGYHELNAAGIPFGFVFVELARELGEAWSVTLSHEALEMIADPDVNLLAMGPHPGGASHSVFHWYEMCDAVQADTYEIDGQKVSNFVLPLYFTGEDEVGARNDFLGTGLKSFGVNPGGYLGFFDPATNQHETYMLEGDTRAHNRMRIKQRSDKTRRSIRYGARMEASAPLYAAAGVDDRRHPTVLRALSLNVPGTTAREAYEAARRVVTSRLGTSWSVEPLGQGGTRFKVVAEDGCPEVSEAWEAAHRLRSDERVAWAEPLFRYEVPIDMSARRASGLFSSDDAPEEMEWALNRIRVPQAWDRFPNLGEAGNGVVIGHPDTGYTRHAEIDGPRLWTYQGYDYFGDDTDAQDDLDSGWLKFPGHGTSTASVIFSSVGPKDRPRYVSGVAPGANLIPFRVSNSVIHLDTLALTESIYGAVRRGCHVISMSLGGLPSLALHQAIVEAVNQGVIILAAAGNYVGFVVWPAAYDEVIAVAASNWRDLPWRHSSRGPAVDVTAPGQGVWNARVESGSNHAVARGSGTSFAVAHCAGVAALWLSFHGRDALIARYGRSGMVSVFKSLLVKTVDTNHDLPPGDYGAGIIDADALLDHPLPDTAPIRGMRTRRVVGPYDGMPDEVAFHLLLNSDRPSDGMERQLMTLPDASSYLLRATAGGRSLTYDPPSAYELAAAELQLVRSMSN